MNLTQNSIYLYVFPGILTVRQSLVISSDQWNVDWVICVTSGAEAVKKLWKIQDSPAALCRAPIAKIICF